MEVESVPETSLNVLSTNYNDTRLGLCEVCGFKNGKYTCPRCEVKTCSLKCNKIHKLEVECDGERDRTKFIPLKRFTNLDLSSDYRLLEEITRNIEVSRKKFGRVPKYNIPFSLMKLKNGAAARKIILKFLPEAFARHRKNCTVFDHKSNVIFWHIDWVFSSADNVIIGDKVSESEKISTAINKYLVTQADVILQEKLQFYQAVGLPGIRLLLKAEGKKGKKFYELDPTMTIRDCLQNRIIIEYPTIHAVLKGHGDEYDIVDSDCEDDMNVENEIKTGREVIDNIIKHSESNESLYNSMKNLLFVSDYTDDEENTFNNE